MAALQSKLASLNLTPEQRTRAETLLIPASEVKVLSAKAFSDFLTEADISEESADALYDLLDEERIALDPTDVPGYPDSLAEKNPSEEELRAIEEEADRERFREEQSVSDYSGNDIQQYFNEIGRFKLLTPKEEQELARRIAQGDREARNTMIECNLRLVVANAKHFINRGLPLLDLIQEGNCGLMKAVEKYDYTLGYRFSTYATWWIKQAISRAIISRSRLLQIPVHVSEDLARILRVQREMEVELNREPTVEELAPQVKLSAEKINTLLRISQQVIPLETTVGEDEDSTLGSFVPADESQQPSEVVARVILRENINEALKTLTEREEKVLRLRFGLYDGREYTLEEIGRNLNVTRERVRQIQAKALRKLGRPAIRKKLQE